jgi:hypothetical protein
VAGGAAAAGAGGVAAAMLGGRGYITYISQVHLLTLRDVVGGAHQYTIVNL